MHYVYILQSYRDKSLYIGYSANLKKRVESHNSKKNTSTRHKAPYKLIFYEAFTNQDDAKNREKYLKTGWGWRSIRKMLKKHLD